MRRLSMVTISGPWSCEILYTSTSIMVLAETIDKTTVKIDGQTHGSGNGNSKGKGKANRKRKG